jgi:2'-5' RNA ligase
MRVFLAVPCGEQLAAALTTALDAWRSGPGAGVAVRWTRPETWHLTLQFLGDWPEGRLAELPAALEPVSDLGGFTLRPGGLGGFPNLKSPRVLFLHMASDGHAALLAERVRAVVNSTWPTGPQDNKTFRSHLTLGRIRKRLPRGDIKLLQDINLGHLPAMDVKGFRLVASELRPQGSRYHTLDFFALRK